MFEKGSQDFLKKQIVFKKLSVFGVYSDFLKWLKNDSEYVELADATLENINFLIMKTCQLLSISSSVFFLAKSLTTFAM